MLYIKKRDTKDEAFLISLDTFTVCSGFYRFDVYYKEALMRLFPYLLRAGADGIIKNSDLWIVNLGLRYKNVGECAFNEHILLRMSASGDA